MKNNLQILIFILFSHLFGNTYSLSGVVKDKVTNEPLIGANVYVEGTSIGAATNTNNATNNENSNNNRDDSSTQIQNESEIQLENSVEVEEDDLW